MIGLRNKYGCIGIDFGASSVKMLQLCDRGDGGPAVAASAYCELPATNDAAERAAAVTDAISAALKTHPFHGREVVAALGPGEFQMKNIRLPKMPPEEMASAVEFEAQDRFELGGASHIRFVPAGEVRHGNELKEEVIVFAARDDLIRQRLEMLQSMKLRPTALDVAPCAAARSFFRFLRRAEDATAINVFLDVGRRGTAILITRGAELSFLKLLGVGGAHLNAAVSKALNLSEEEAGNLRIRIMHEHAGRRAGDPPETSDEVRARVADAVRATSERIARDVQLCLRYFSVTFRGQRPDSVTLVGGEAHEPVLSQVISEAVDVPCIIGHPLRGVSQPSGPGTRNQRTLQPAWAVATGLALRGTRWIPTSGPGLRSASAAVVAA